MRYVWFFPLLLLLSAALSGCGGGEEAADGECTDDTPSCRMTTPTERGGGGIPGLTPCGTLFVCNNNCSGQAECEEQCASDASSQVVTQYGQLVSCLLAHDCYSVANPGMMGQYNACVYDGCLGTYQSCFGPLPAQDGSCGESLGCMDACKSTDQGCMETCAQASTLTAQTLYFHILACAEISCPGHTGAAWATCTNTLCATEVSVCLEHIVE